jgi:hypothetical protein
MGLPVTFRFRPAMSKMPLPGDGRAVFLKACN